MLEWSSPFIDRFLKMSLLRFYPGVTPGKKRKPIAIDDENQKTEKRNRCMKTIVLTGNFLQKWQTEQPWLVFDEEKNVMTCTTSAMLEVECLQYKH